MIQDMKTILTRLFTVTMLMMISMVAKADVKVLYGEKGTETFEGKGGSIKMEQTDSKDVKTKVTVYLTFIPDTDKGFVFDESTLEVYAVVSPRSASTRAPEISGDPLTLTKEKTDVSSAKRYSVNIDPNLALWVKSADFKKKESGAKWNLETHPNAGVWYITNSTNSMTGYWVPAANPQVTTEGHVYEDAYFSSDYNTQDGDPEKPFLTTYPTDGDLNSIWIFVPVSDEANYYYIVHALTGKYLKFQTYYSDARRKYVHLETITSPGDTEKFLIETISPYVKIKPKKHSYYMNVAGTNQKRYNGKDDKNTAGYYSGMIGGYSSIDDGSKFTLVDASSATDLTPVVSDVDGTNNTFTITSPAAAFSTIRYTTDGSTTPDASTGTAATSGSDINITESWTVQAVGVFGTADDTFVTPVAGPQNLAPIPCATPVISFDYTTSEVSITCSTPNTTIYYTTNGNIPTASDTEFNGQPFTVTGTTTVKAIATRTNFPDSEVGELTISQVATPTIQNNGSNAISITCATEDATIYYTTDGSTPNTSSSVFSEPLKENVSGVTIKAIAVKEGMITSTVRSGSVTLQCEEPIIARSSNSSFTVTCPFPASGVTIYYTTNGNTPTTSSSSTTSGGTIPCELPATVKAFAVAIGYDNSTEASAYLTQGMGGDGSAADPYTIEYQSDVADFNTKANTAAEASKHYKVIATETLDFSGVDAITQAFSGTFDGGNCVLTGLSHALFNTVDGGTVKNVTLENVNIQSGDSDGDAGAICNKAEGSSRIYNCGILPTEITRDEDGNITGFSGSSVSGSRYVGGLVGMLSGTSRVINCYSYANVSGGSIAAGIVGNNSETTTLSSLNTMVMNCMFYGNITSASTMKPVYGGTVISNAGASGVNNYNYYRNGDGVTFDDSYSAFSDYYCSLPADEEYLTRFEYYRSILNSNKKLCTWWINGTSGTAPTDAEVEAIGIAKWVLDPGIAPYPILKKWGKYPSVINQDKTRVWDPRTKDADGTLLTPQWVNRSSAPAYHGKQLGTINVTVNAGAKHAGTGSTSVTLNDVAILDMDTLNYDYGYYKIQLPYYNEQFGDPTADAATQWDNRYAGNYKDYVVTGWKIKSINGGTAGSFKGYSSTAASDAVSAADVTPDVPATTAWEDGFNFADRYCTNKDLYSVSGRVFAQGGYYYVPEGVSSITIEAYWGKAVYLHNSEHSIDRVNVAATASDGRDGKDKDDTAPADFGSAFTPAGTLSTTFQGETVRTSLQEAITNLPFTGTSYTVYDQAIVLVGNVQVKNRGDNLGRGTADADKSNNKPFTIMSCDLDFDNEPDYCLQLQQRNTTNRPGIHPVRFDFLPVPELGLAIRTNTFAYTIGLMVPQGHFEITETSFMHTTQFEYDAAVGKAEAPLILNGGHFEQIVVRYGPKNRTSYIILGGNFRMKRFTPGYHASSQNDAIRHCAVNAIGGEYPEFYLSGIYMPDKATLTSDNPHCYTNGGHFGLMAGAGYEQVKGNVTFKIDHSIIGEFYGGGINAAKPVTGNIDVTINNSLVAKYCGGPKVGVMSIVNGKLKTVTTNATGTTFGVFYGGGNGGTSYYREKKRDNTGTFPTTKGGWDGYNAFNPLNQVSGVNAAYENGDGKKWGYHAEYEFEVFNSSNGLKSGEDVIRVYYRWAQFGITTTGDVTNTLTDCTIKGDFFGGGNLADVTGNVTSTLKGRTHVNGSAFAAGYSASIPSFPVHDKSTVRIPTHDAAGNVDEQGSLDYYQDGGKDRKYTWCYKNASGKVFPEGVDIPSDAATKTTGKSAFQYDGNWYVLTDVSLEGLGAVNGDAKIILKDNCKIDGSVYGGGDSSVVNGNTTVELYGNTGNTEVDGNVFGGGNKGEVSGNTTVNIEYEETTNPQQP